MRPVARAMVLALAGAAIPFATGRDGPSSRAPGREGPEAGPSATALRSCLESVAAGADDPGSVRACLPQAEAILFGERDLERGRARLREAIAGVGRAGDAGESARASVILAASEWSLFARDRGPALLRARAIQDSLDALDAIDAHIDESAPGLARARAFRPWASFHHHVTDAILRSLDDPPSASDLDLVFQFTERMRSRVLLEDLDRIYGAESGVTAGGEGVPVPGDRADLLAALADDEALLSFVIAEEPEAHGEDREGSWLLVHTAGATRVYPVTSGAGLDHEVKIFLGQIANRDGSDVILASTLYRRLLERPLRDLPSKVVKLVVVPDGPLHSLSFSGLRRDARSDPVGVTYMVTVAPSATAWLRWRPARARARRLPAVVVADPILSAAVAGTVVGAPPAAGSETAGAAGPGDLSASMPFARREARAIRRRLGRSLLREGPAASENFIKTARLRDYAVLHIAAHAVIDERAPLRSAILLAPGSGPEDGRLEASEIAALDLEGTVVVLAVCSGARGEILDGEGDLSLARAFLQAGAEAVVGSLWPLRDDEAAALFDAFYGALADGLSVRASLAAARRERFLDGAATAAWAGPVLHGRGDARPFPGGRGDAGSDPPALHVASLVAAGVAAAIGIALYATLATRRHLRRQGAGARL